MTFDDLRHKIGDEEYEARMKAARERALWELGDETWAGVIVSAFLYPTEDSQALEMEKN